MSEWISVKDDLPKTSKPVWVAAKEFGQPYVFAVADFWKSSMPNSEPKWFLNRNFYRLDNQLEIAQEVTHWQELPEPPKERP